MWDLVMFLREAGWAVSFVSENPSVGERYARLLRQRGVAVYRGFDQRADVLIESGRFDLAVFAFWYIAEQLIPRVRALSPQTRIAVHTIDLHFVRAARQRFVLGSEGRLDSDYASEMARELNVYAASDAVFTVSEKEAALVNDLTGTPDLAVVVSDTEEAPRSSRPFAERNGIVFIGNFRHPPNVEAVEYLCTRVVPLLPPKVLDQHPLRIVGNQLDHKIEQFGRGLPNVQMVGWVPSIIPYLHRSRIEVVPLRHGAGTKRKVLQGFAAGTPMVVTSIGLEGLDVEDGVHALRADDASTFAHGIERLVEDRDLWQRLADNGRDYVEREFNRQEVRKRFMETVEGVLDRVPKAMDVDLEALGLTSPILRSRYQALVARIQESVSSAADVGATVAVISRGDPELLQFDRCTGWHFPQAPDGSYAGFHPKDSDEAIRHLEDLRRNGASFLVIPKTASWWLEHYREFAEHLARSYEEVTADADTCRLFRLAEPAGQRTSDGAQGSAVARDRDARG